MLNLVFSCKDPLYDLRKEAVWALSNICYRLTDKQRIMKLIENDVMIVLIELL